MTEPTPIFHSVVRDMARAEDAAYIRHLRLIPGGAVDATAEEIGA